MKHTFTFLLTLSLLLTTVLPMQTIDLYAETASSQESSTSVEAASTQASETSTQASDTSAQATDTEAASSTEEDTSLQSSYSNPIGDTSSYYDMDSLGSGPDITADSAMLMDANTGAILYDKEGTTRRYPASITKVMTALLAIENCKMDEVITFSNEAVNGIEAGSSSAGINVGAELTVEDTLYAMMLVSANEAAAAIAEHVAGSVDAFAQMMTSRAAELGCTDTNFTNPHGLPDENHYTTARDMALILKEAVTHEEFRKIASADSYTLEASDTLTNTLELWNHAKILRENSDYYYEYAEGAKTGYTQAALNTLVTYGEKDGVELLCVILKDYGADNSYYDTKSLFEWGFDKVKTITPLSGYDLDGALSQETSLKDQDISSLKATVSTDYSILVPTDFDESTLKTSFVYKEDAEAQTLGSVEISSGDTVIGRAPVSYTAASDATGSGNVSDDIIEMADVDKDGFTPRKLFSYVIRVIIALILIYVIMSLISHHQAEKRRQKRIRARKRKKESSNGSSGKKKR